MKRITTAYPPQPGERAKQKTNHPKRNQLKNTKQQFLFSKGASVLNLKNIIHIPEYKPFILLFITAMLFNFSSVAQVVVYPAPAGAPTSTKFSVKVNGQDVPVYNGAGPGNDTYYFCYFDFGGAAVSVEVTGSGISLSTPQIRPMSSGIKPSVSGSRAGFSISKQGQYAFIPNGSNYANALFIFANPLEVNPPKQGDPGVVYYGPGVHQVDNLNLNSNQTLYIHGSAFLKGGLNLSGKSNINIRGRGILDGMDWAKWTGPTGYKYGIIRLQNTSNVTIEGIVLRGSWAASIHVWTSDKTMIDNVKVCNSRFANEDGIAPINTKNMTIKNTFIRTNDDCIPIKGYNSSRANCENILVENCVLWCDRARIILMGSETMVHNMKNVRFTNCEIIHYEMPIFNVQATEEGTVGPNVVLENINIQSDNSPPSDFKEFIRIISAVESWAQLQTPGFVDGVTVRNINLTGPQNGGKLILIQGYDNQHTAKNVTIECFRHNGNLISKSSSGVTIGNYTSNIVFNGCAATSIDPPPTAQASFSALYPNPANGNVLLSYHLNDFFKVKISVFDASGKEVMLVVNENQYDGEHAVPINTSGLQNGFYFVKIALNDDILTKKLIVNH